MAASPGMQQRLASDFAPSVPGHFSASDSKSRLLVAVVQELSLARTLDQVMAIVRRAARQLTGADGATFVLRDQGFCHYADEDAISPLWKGQRFPLQACISGWAMLNRQAVAIEDIYADSRIPHDAYRPTFVKSLVMVPIRTVEPVGAIGNYWAQRHQPTGDEVMLLSALADSTSIAMENVGLYQTLERKVEERTAELAASRAELRAKNEALLRAERQKEELTALLVHDIKSPANGIMLSCQARLRKADLSEDERRAWKAVHAGASSINRMALNLLDIARAEDGAFVLKPAEVEVGALLGETARAMEAQAEGRGQRIAVSVTLGDPRLRADAEVLRRVLQNVVENALRHSPRDGSVSLSASDGPDGAVELRIADEGPGIPEELRAKVFDRYTRLESTRSDVTDRGNRGLGLTFCRLAVELHQGKIWVEANQPRGSLFVIRLPRG